VKSVFLFCKKSVALTIGTFSATEFSAQWALNSVSLNSVKLKVPIVSATDLKKKTEALSLGLGPGINKPKEERLDRLWQTFESDQLDPIYNVRKISRGRLKIESRDVFFFSRKLCANREE